MSNHNLNECKNCYWNIPKEKQKNELDKTGCEVYTDVNNVITDSFGKCYSRIINKSEYNELLRSLEERK